MNSAARIPADRNLELTQTMRSLVLAMMLVVGSGPAVSVTRAQTPQETGGTGSGGQTGSNVNLGDQGSGNTTTQDQNPPSNSTPPPDTTTPIEPLTQEEAEARLPPPLPVVALTPRTVFDSPHPLIRAALNAWIASLDGNRDRFGNLMGPNYAGAQTPDTLRTDLVTFIANFVQGKMLVGISQRHANGLANLQAANRAALIRQMVFDSLPDDQKRRLIAASSGKDKNGNGNGGNPASPGNSNPSGNGNGSTDEDVPNTNDVNNTNGGSGSGDGGNSGSGGSTGSGGGTGDSGSSGSSGSSGGDGGDGNGGGDDPPAPGVAGEIEKEFNVRIASEPKEFNEYELTILRQVLTEMPVNYYKNTPMFQRIGRIDGDVNGTIYAVTISSLNPDNSQAPGTVQLSDLYAGQEDGDYRSGTHPYPIMFFETVDICRRNTLKHVFHHELTHNYLFQITPKYEPKQEHQIYIDWASTFGWDPESGDELKSKFIFRCDRVQETVTTYGWYGNLIGEDVCETVAMHFMNPSRLEKAATAPTANGRSRLAFVEDRMELAGLRKSGDNTDIQPECLRFPCDCPGQ